jgi:hypothetical protein
MTKVGRHRVQSRYSTSLNKNEVEKILERWQANVVKCNRSEITIMRLSTSLNSSMEVVRDIARLFGAWNSRKQTIVGYSLKPHEDTLEVDSASSHSFTIDDPPNDLMSASSHSFSIDDSASLTRMRELSDKLTGTGKGNIGKALGLSIEDGNQETLEDAFAMIDKESLIKCGP